MECYGFRGKILGILTSYFKDRKQYVNLDTFNSTIIESPEGGVVQGSKMSGTMFNLYVNEVPDLFKLIYHPTINIKILTI